MGSGIIKKLFKKIFPLEKYEKIEGLIKFIVFKDFRNRCPRKKSYGKLNRDKNFYVLGVDSQFCGILSLFLQYMVEMEWAIKRGYIPVVDMKNHFAQSCQNQENAYQENAWEYYFVQPYSLEEVYQSKNVIQCWREGSCPNKISWTYKVLQPEEIERWSPIVKKYMDFRPEIKMRAEKFWREHIPEGKKVLGVEVRAGFLSGEIRKLSLHQGHPRCKSLSERIEEIQALVQKWKYDYIFIISDDREWLEEISANLAVQCIYTNHARTHFFERGEAVLDLKEVYQEFEGIDIREKTEDYLVDVYILAKCQGISAMLSSAGHVAQLLNGGSYEQVFISSEEQIDIENREE